MSQTRFASVPIADEVFRQLYLKQELRAEEGNTFKLELNAEIPYEDTVETGTITLYVDRATALPAYTHPNGDPVITTWARVQPNGEPFSIDVTLPAGETHQQGATIVVSDDMDRIIHEFLEREDRTI